MKRINTSKAIMSELNPIQQQRRDIGVRKQPIILLSTVTEPKQLKFSTLPLNSLREGRSINQPIPTIPLFMVSEFIQWKGFSGLRFLLS